MVKSSPSLVARTANGKLDLFACGVCHARFWLDADVLPPRTCPYGHGRLRK